MLQSMLGMLQSMLGTLQSVICMLQSMLGPLQSVAGYAAKHSKHDRQAAMHGSTAACAHLNSQEVCKWAGGCDD